MLMTTAIILLLLRIVPSEGSESLPSTLHLDFTAKKAERAPSSCTRSSWDALVLDLWSEAKCEEASVAEAWKYHKAKASAKQLLKERRGLLSNIEIKVLLDVCTSTLSGDQALETTSTIQDFVGSRVMRPLSYPICKKPSYQFSLPRVDLKPFVEQQDGFVEQADQFADALGKREIALFASVLALFNIALHFFGGSKAAPLRNKSPEKKKIPSAPKISPTPSKEKRLKTKAKKSMQAKGGESSQRSLEILKIQELHRARAKTPFRQRSINSGIDKENVQNAVLMGVGFVIAIKNGVQQHDESLKKRNNICYEFSFLFKKII